MHVEVEIIKFSSVNGEFLRNTIDVSLAPYHYHMILQYPRIQSFDLADIRSHPILCVCLRYLQVSNGLDHKQPRKSGDTIIPLIRLQTQCSQVHRQAFVRIRKHSDCLRGIANIRNMFLNSDRKAYSQHILMQLQAILINNNAFVVIVRRLQEFASIRIE